MECGCVSLLRIVVVGGVWSDYIYTFLPTQVVYYSATVSHSVTLSSGSRPFPNHDLRVVIFSALFIPRPHATFVEFMKV